MVLLNKIKTILGILLDQITEFFPFFLAFYAICLFLSFSFTSWRSSLNWNGFNMSVLVLGILFLLNKWRLGWAVKKIKNKKWFFAKTIITLGILAYSILHGVNLFEFLILFLGCAALFFGLDIIFVGGLALFLLILCPILLLSNNDKLAELLSVYVYYLFIVIMVVQFKNLMFRKRITISIKEVSSSQ